MSSEGFRGVPGVPEGWELVRIDCVTNGEHYVHNGVARLWGESKASCATYPIIRKIETPKKYRPFANGAEYMAENSTAVAVDWREGVTNGFYAVVSANASFVWVAFGDKIETFDWKQAFWKLQFRHADGSTSPFGVEVTE